MDIRGTAAFQAQRLKHGTVSVSQQRRRNQKEMRAINAAQREGDGAKV